MFEKRKFIKALYIAATLHQSGPGISDMEWYKANEYVMANNHLVIPLIKEDRIPVEYLRFCGVTSEDSFYAEIEACKNEIKDSTYQYIIGLKKLHEETRERVRKDKEDYPEDFIDLSKGWK